MLWAVAQPAACAGLIAAFLLGTVLRQGVISLGSQHRFSFRPRRDIDPFGAVAGLVSGVGFGRGRAASSGWLATLAPPLAVLAVAQLPLMLYRVLELDRFPLRFYTGADILRGAPGPALSQFLLALGVGLAAFGLLELVPLPPLDGWLLIPEPRGGTGWAKTRYWLAEQNVGLAIVLAGLLLPLWRGIPPWVALLDLVLTPWLRWWV